MPVSVGLFQDQGLLIGCVTGSILCLPAAQLLLRERTVRAAWIWPLSTSLLVHFVRFFVVGVFFAALAILLQKQFFFGLEFVFDRNVILALAYLTDERELDALFFLGHGGIIA